MTIEASIEALLATARERYEDALVADAARIYLIDVSTVPNDAWGTLPWSDKWRRDWESAQDSRFREVCDLRDELGAVSGGLMQVAADYTGTDQQMALSFNDVQEDLRPYLAATHREGSTSVYRPGGGGDEPPVYSANGAAPVIQDGGNARLRAIHNEKLPQIKRDPSKDRISIGAGVDGNGFSLGVVPDVQYLPGPEHDQLDEFVSRYYETLLQLEGFIDSVGSGHKKPLSDVIIHAWRCCPTVIANRSDLLFTLENTYNAIKNRNIDDTRKLLGRWEGDAAQAFGQYSEIVSRYTGEIAAEIKWLATEGKKAASTLSGLRNAYAKLGHEHINQLLEAIRQYNETVQSALSVCQNPEEALPRMRVSAPGFSPVVKARAGGPSGPSVP